MKKLSLRLRLTVINMLLLLLCCLGLTLLLNHAAGNMADTIEAMPISPAYTIGSNDTALTVTPAGSTQASAAVLPTQHSEASLQARTLFMRNSYLYMLLTVAAGGFLTWFITGRTLHPLKKLSKEMQNRTVQNLSDELPVPESNDEIASLTRSFNEMNRKLNEAFSTQKRFAQSAAHELRTPLTVLKAKVDVFRKKPEHTPEEYEQLLQMAETQTDRLASLVNDLLGLTNLEDLPCDRKVFLRPLLTELADEFTALTDEYHVSLTFHTADLQTVGNLNLLRRAFSNLIENAIKYNVPGGKVTVTMEEQNKKVLIRIADTGQGIPDGQKALIFEPFYRVDKSRSRRMGGAGLGLATVKAIIEMHQGDILVEDATDGGSIFTVILRAAQQ